MAMLKTPNPDAAAKVWLRRISKDHFNGAYDAYLRFCSREDHHRQRVISNMQSISWCKALYSWFVEQDLRKFRSYTWQCSLWSLLRQKIKPAYGVHSYDYQTFKVLLSNDEELIHWHSQMILAGFDNQVEIQNKEPDCMCLSSWSAMGLQLRLVLQRDWKRVVKRSEAVLANPTCARKNDLTLWQFYLALAEGDTKMMSKTVNKLTTAGSRRAYDRTNDYAGHVIGDYAIAMNKLAAREGYELDVDSPWIPKEWLENDKGDRSLLMKEVANIDVFEPFAINNRWSAYEGKDYTELNPRPLGEPPVTFDDHWKFFKGDAPEEFYFSKRWAR